jgi:hypothetical protein
MRSKLLIMSTAALLAGTVAAASQSIQPGGTQEKGQQGRSQGTKSNEVGRDQVKGLTQGEAERDQDKLKGKTQGQAERDQDKPKSKKTQGQAERGQDKLKSQTQGQTQRDQDKARPGQAEGQNQNQQGQNQRDQNRVQQGGREGERGSNVSVSFTTEQRTKIRETVFKERNAPRLGKVDFTIKEGTIIPRTVRIVEIPDVIVEIHPEWRGYRYFIVNNELVIVEPDTFRIVAVVDV